MDLLYHKTVSRQYFFKGTIQTPLGISLQNRVEPCNTAQCHATPYKIHGMGSVMWKGPGPKGDKKYDIICIMSFYPSNDHFHFLHHCFLFFPGRNRINACGLNIGMPQYICQVYQILIDPIIGVGKQMP